MARKVVNRKALREEADAAEKMEKAAPKATKAKAAKEPGEKAAPKKKKSKAAESLRIKLYWQVLNGSGKQIALFEYSQKKQAEAKAEELSAGANKARHYIQKLKKEEPVANVD